MTPPTRVLCLTDDPSVVSLFSEVVGRTGCQLQAVAMPLGVLSGMTHPDFKDAALPALSELALQRAANLHFLNGKAALTEFVRQSAPDLLLCFCFPWRLPPELLEVPKLGALNGHPSFLPRYWGNNPIGWALRNRDEKIGFTVHRMVATYDSGPILEQDGMAVSPHENWSDLSRRIRALCTEVFVKAVPRALAGEPGAPQREELATDANIFEEGYDLIDWAAPAQDIHNKVRSFSGMGAIGEVEGSGLRVLSCRVEEPLVGDRRDLKPGSVVSRDADSLVVQCGDRPLRLTQFSSEHRGHARHPVRVPVRVSSGSREIETYTQNLSAVGAMIEIAEPLCPVGSPLHLRFQPEGRPGFLLAGVLERVEFAPVTGDFTGLGVRFVSLGDRERAAIQALLPFKVDLAGAP